MVQFQPVFGNFSPFGGVTLVAPNVGLGGNFRQRWPRDRMGSSTLAF
jgi:hypothetical protein